MSRKPTVKVDKQLQKKISHLDNNVLNVLSMYLNSKISTDDTKSLTRPRPRRSETKKDISKLSSSKIFFTVRHSEHFKRNTTGKG